MNWQLVTETQPSIHDMEVLGYNEKWIDEDFNPNGVRACFRCTIVENGDGFCMAVWENDQDCYNTRYTHPESIYYVDEPDNVPPTHYCIITKPK